MPFPKKKIFVQSQSVNLSTKNRVIFLNSKVEAVSYVLGKTHIKKVFFCGWTTKGVGRGNPPDH